MFIELIRKNDDSSKEEPEEEGSKTTEWIGAKYFDIFPTRSELAYYKYLMCSIIPLIFLRNPIIMKGYPSNLKIPCNIGHVNVEKAYCDPNSPLNIMTRMMYNRIIRRKLDPRENSNRGDISSIIDPRLSQVVLGKPFVEISNMTHDSPKGVVRFTDGTEEDAYKMPHMIEKYNSLSNLEKEHTKSVYLRNEEDKRIGLEYTMSKILGFYKECLELGPEYVIRIDDEDEVIYEDLVQGNITIKRVYYVEGLNHNLFVVGQFCDADLEVAFRKSTRYIRDLKGNDLLTDSRDTDLYSITLQDTSTPNPICLMAKATSSQAWLWHRRLSHLNFDTINLISKYDIVTGLSKLKFVKDHLCSSCELGKAKCKSFKTKTIPSLKRRLQILHMDLYGLVRIKRFNGKKYVLVIVDDYSRYTWTHFLRSKDKTPKVLNDFLKLVQRGLHAQVRTVRTEKGTKFLNKTLHAYFAQEGIKHQTSTARTPEQNDVVKRRNPTLVEAANANLSLGPQSQENVPQTAETVTTSNELDLLISLMFDELLNRTTQVVSKSFAANVADTPDKRQQHNINQSTTIIVTVDIPPLNIQTTPETTS
nr:retrovirus-related Pol polyprotein from transposon TNT 1-94 [Tanacetum cinerariifolium]